MTTTFDADPTENTVAGLWATDLTESVPIFDTDASAQTIAEAWSSSPLDVPDGRYDDPKDDNTDERRRDGERARLFAVLAAGIIGGATVGAVLFGSIDPPKPTFIVPNSGVSTSPLPPSSGPGSTAPAAPKPAATAPAQKPAGQALVPNLVAPQPEPAPPAPNDVVDPGMTPPVVTAPPVVINIPIPPLPPAQPVPDPEPPAPQDPPAPKPPVFNPGNIEVAQLPQPEDDPDPSRWTINPEVQKPQRTVKITPDNDDPKRTQLSSDAGSRFTGPISKP